ncbi:beta-propeller fold lactonase family protein [candidate division WOR-3 bacterium]|nr:beta-propeller fold lactonase family protein [candidate division WOR-3 bacterium]
MKVLKIFLILLLSILVFSSCEQNSPPDAPNTPIGPSRGIRNELLTYKSATTDPDGGNISYQFEWGDDNLSSWSSYIPSGDTISMNHSYADIGVFEIRVRAKDDYRPLFQHITVGAISDWSPAHIVVISEVDTTNTPPNTPAAPVGPTEGYTDSSYIFTSSTTDPDGDSISYQFDWGDGDLSAWSDYLPSGESMSISHSYGDAGTYVVKVRAKDEKGAESEFSPGYQIIITEYQLTDYPYRVTDIISVGSRPHGITCLPNGDYVYVTNVYSYSVSVIRTSDNLVVNEIPVGYGPRFVTPLPNGEYVYVTNMSSNDIYVIRTSDNTVEDTIYVGYAPHGIVSLPDGKFLYVAVRDENKVSVIRTSDNTIVDNIPVGTSPKGVEVLPNGEFVYVTNWYSYDVYVIRTIDNTVIKTIPVGVNPVRVASHPDGDYVYVTNRGSNYVSVIRTLDNIVVDEIPVGDKPIGIVFLPNGEYGYVVNEGNNNVLVLRTLDNAIIDTISVDQHPYDGISLPNGQYIYITNLHSDNVSVIGY